MATTDASDWSSALERLLQPAFAAAAASVCLYAVGSGCGNRTRHRVVMERGIFILGKILIELISIF